MDFQLRGRHALVCGASQGLGKAIATALAEEGASLTLCSRSLEKLSVLETELKTLQKEIESVAVNLSDVADRQRLIGKIKTRPSDILVFNTGGPPTLTAEGATLAQWQAGFEALFLAMLDLIHAVLPSMKENDWGRIVIVTSLAAIEPAPNLVISNTLRAGVSAYAKTLANEVAKHNITVNCVAPGYIETERLRELYADAAKEKPALIPMGRLGAPREIGDVVAFLCSGQASYVTGVTLTVDGGLRRSAV